VPIRVAAHRRSEAGADDGVRGAHHQSQKIVSLLWGSVRSSSVLRTLSLIAKKNPARGGEHDKESESFVEAH